MDEMFKHEKVIDDWKSGNWQGILDWFGDFDINLLCKP